MTATAAAETFNFNEEIEEEKSGEFDNITIPYTFKLNYPITLVNGDVLESLEVFRRLTGNDIMQLSSDDIKIGDLAIMFSKVTAQPKNSVIGKLDASDLIRGTTLVASFLKRGQKSGKV